jgi:hypothetical protein
MVKIIKLPLFWMVFVYVHIHFRIWTRIQIPRATDPVPDSDPANVDMLFFKSFLLIPAKKFLIIPL